MPKSISPSQILSRDEVRLVIETYRRACSFSKRSRDSIQRRLNHTIFRLAACCGLRSIEIAGLDLCDAILNGEKPALRIRKSVTKGRANERRGRFVPLWWDAGTLQDLKQWREFRVQQVREQYDAGLREIRDQDIRPGKTTSKFMRPFDGNWGKEPLVCHQENGPVSGDKRGFRFHPRLVAKKWRTAIKSIGPERAKAISIHRGRSTFASHALAAGRTLVEVRDACGHASVQTTSRYLHALESNAPDVFGYAEALPWEDPLSNQREQSRTGLTLPAQLLHRLEAWAAEEHMPAEAALAEAVRRMVRPDGSTLSPSPIRPAVRSLPIPAVGRFQTEMSASQR